ncbi:secretory calcium-binding phosphoprotein 9 isoform X2 [Gouania willdenowi]|uniref:secretory calcium-binding phosphoprotein 9 isoform X2 n=1 Tax=Gouania willdenowi TaxID=441366 RepID=UPI0010560AEF|nr:elastin-like isoform X2 [Gouania willdenowi]
MSTQVAAGKTKRLLAAINAGVLPGINGAVLPGINGGLLPGVNGGLLPGVNGGLLPGINGGLLPGVNGGLLPVMNGGLGNGVNPGLIAGRLNPPMVAGGGAGFMGQPQFAQFVPAAQAFAPRPQIPNPYSFPAFNVPLFNGVPQMGPMNPAQQPLMGFVGGAVPQQLPPQPDVVQRFRRDTRMSENALKSNVDTQIPSPNGPMTTPPPLPCVTHQDNNQV